LLALAGCGADHPDPKFYCPNVAVLQQTSQLDEFLPSGMNITDEITEAHVTGVAGACTLQPSLHAVRVSFQIGFTATNGPANKANALELPYFVSVVRGDRILSKQLYHIPVSFDGNVSIAGVTSKPVNVELPDLRVNDGTQILVGFQLTPEQEVYAQDHPSP
jgi:hypothetical protein